MIPKLQNCIDAIHNGVSRVHILDGRIPHCLLLEIFTNKGIGTAILKDDEEKFYHEGQVIIFRNQSSICCTPTTVPRWSGREARGVHLYDTDGKEYLDFAAGIAVYALGYGNTRYNEALKEQVDQILHTSNLFYNIPQALAAEKLVRASGSLSKVFFTNSGTEAIEGSHQGGPEVRLSERRLHRP